MEEGLKKDRETVCILGLGFVGAAMGLAVANARGVDNNLIYNVIGIDLSTKQGIERANKINEGIFPFESTDKLLLEAQKKAYKNKNFLATTNPDYLKEADIVVVDINLDVCYSDDGNPYLNLDAFKNAIVSLGQKIRENTLVVIETTVPPGTCEKVVLGILKEQFEIRNFDINNVLLAHSYERVMPGKDYYNSIVNYWRVYSGINDISAEKCEKFLSNVINTKDYPLRRLKNTTASETAKVLENSYRAVNIAFIEEWGRLAEETGVDLFEVLDAIRMRPTHSNIRQPGFGVGGYCLTKDPYFASLAAKEIWELEGMNFPFSTKAVQINNNMPLVSLNKVENLLGGNLQGKKLLIIGVSYRQDVGDTRYSPAEIFVKEAIHKGAKTVCYDPLVKYWEEMDTDVMQSIPDFNLFDAVVFTVAHEAIREIDFDNYETNGYIVFFDTNKVLSEKQIQQLIKKRNVLFGAIGRGDL